MLLFCYALLCVHSSFAIILKGMTKLEVLLLLSYRCIVTINVLWLFLTVLLVCLKCVIVVCPDRAHLLFVLNHPKKTYISICRKYVTFHNKIVYIFNSHAT